MEATREIEEIQSEGDTDVSLPPDSEEKTEEEPSTSRQKPTPVNAGFTHSISLTICFLPNSHALTQTHTYTLIHTHTNTHKHTPTLI